MKQKITNFFIKAFQKIDFFLIQCYFIFFNYKNVKEWYQQYITISVDSWRAASELQFYYFLVVDTYQVQPLFKIKQTLIFPKLCKRLKLKIRYIQHPAFNRKKAKNWYKSFNEVIKKVPQKKEIIKQGRNEKCNCNSGKKFKDCCLKTWDITTYNLEKISKLQPFLKRPEHLKNPFF